MTADGPRLTFRPHEHLRRPADFKRAFDRRRSAADGRLIVYVCENGLPHLRLGLSVSRKNRPGRPPQPPAPPLPRSVPPDARDEMPVGLDLVLVPRRPEQPTLEELKKGAAAAGAAGGAEAGTGGPPTVIGKILAPLRYALKIFLDRWSALLSDLPAADLAHGVPVRAELGSEYMIAAVNKYGPLRGACKGVWRICRCNPWTPAASTRRE